MHLINSFKKSCNNNTFSLSNNEIQKVIDQQISLKLNINNYNYVTLSTDKINKKKIAEIARNAKSDQKQEGYSFNNEIYINHDNNNNDSYCTDLQACERGMIF